MLVGNSAVRTSACVTVRFCAGISSTSTGLMSMAVTDPAEPTASHSHSVTLPLPLPSSRQFQPGPTPSERR